MRKLENLVIDLSMQYSDPIAGITHEIMNQLPLIYVLLHFLPFLHQRMVSDNIVCFLMTMHVGPWLMAKR